jgi:hypothetical protein
VVEAAHRFLASCSKNICVAVGVDPDQCGPELLNWSGRVQDTNNEKFVDARTSRAYSRADHKVRIGRWRENLSEDDIRRVIPIVKDAAAEFDYELPV